jgi:hypothetical protein|tara:strand:+ start:2050 stop:2424 length:375 start_codon:yes stop_codon:yes gene_type:complete
MIYLVIFSLSLLILNNLLDNVQGYLNYEDIGWKPIEKNCPQQHANNYNKLVSPDKLTKFFGSHVDESSYREVESSKSAKSSKSSKSAVQLIQPFGYTNNAIFDVTRFIESSEPLPTGTDFFKNI